jgi:hypothetical protein
VKALHFGAMGAVLLLLFVFGCGENASPQKSAADKQARIQANLEKLDPADLRLVQEQKYCAIETDKLLGEMGKPIKVMVKDQPVFVCCKGCEKAAKADPDETLDTVKKLKTANAPPVNDASPKTR